MPKKRIAVITAKADDSEQKAILDGITDAAISLNCDVAVFTNIYNHWIIDKFLNFENIIYDFFAPELFDGVIVTGEAYRDLSMLDSVIKKIRGSGIPAVAVGMEIEGFLSVKTDDAADMEHIVDHIVGVHGFRDIDILTGRKDDPVALLRLSGCRKALEKHGLTLDENKIHYGNFWNNTGEELAQKYLSGELPMPQAVICTNDYMAYGLCDALTAGGVEIPDRITVTGYDCTESRTYHYPFLTTYRRNRRKMGADAVGLLFAEECVLCGCGENLICGDTCSCGVDRAELSEEIHSARINKDRSVAISRALLFTDRLTLCRTLAEYTSVIREFFYLLHDAQKLYLCLDKSWNSDAYEGEDFLCCAIDQSSCELPVTFHRNVLLPALSEEHAKPIIYYFIPLHFQSRLFGYTALSYNAPYNYDPSMLDWNKTVANALEFLRMKNNIHYLRQCLRDSTLYDSLTGFYNLREFRGIMAEVSAGDNSLYAVKLSFYNGNEFSRGENYRSDVISDVAGAIKQAGVNHEIFCRAKDDLFLALSKNPDRLFSDRLKAIIHHSLAGRYDETVVSVTYASVCGADSRALSSVCETAERLADEENEKIRERSGQTHYNALLKIHEGIHSSPKSVPCTTELCKRLCVSEGYFRAIYRKCFGISYNQDCIDARIMLARYLLCTTAMSVYSIAISCGYTDEKYFARQFRQYVGCSPMKYRGEAY